MSTRCALGWAMVWAWMLVAGCKPVEQKSEPAARSESRPAANPAVTAARNVRKQLKKIQAHGEVDIEVMSQITAIHDAYQKFLDSKGSSPSSWIDLQSVGAMSGVVQEAERAGAWVRFGISPEQLAAEDMQAEKWVAIKSANDGTIWALTFGGDFVRLTEEEFQSLATR